MTAQQPDPEFVEISQEEYQQLLHGDLRESSAWLSIPRVVRVAMILTSVVVIASVLVFLAWVAVMVFTGTALLG